MATSQGGRPGYSAPVEEATACCSAREA